MVWLIYVNATGNLVKSVASPPLTAPTSVLINDMQDGEVYALSLDLVGDIIQTPQPPGTVTQTNQIPVSSPAGALWFIQMVNGSLRTVAGSYPCNTPISTLGLNVLNRLEENAPPYGPIFWSLQYEIYSGLVEAMNDLLLLIGRPTQAVTQPIILTPNTVWQPVPKGIFLLTDLYGPQGALRQVTVPGMDYVQASWGPDWENDVADYPLHWGAVGFNYFIVHPAPKAPLQLTLNAIQYPAMDNWPYQGTELVPFQHEFHVALELYAAGYAMMKETGREAEEGVTMYGQYLALAQRMTQIADMRDPVIFSKALGAPTVVDAATKR